MATPTYATEKAGSDLFIVDNADDDWKVLNYLREWTEISRAFDIATGYFDIASLLALDGEWQKLEKIRILMGDEVTRRTRQALLEGVAQIAARLDASIEREKEKNDFLTGVPAIVEGLARGQIACRVYAKKKFHAKAYITHSRLAVVGSSALVGSSNFTFPGLTQNVELNVQLRREVEALQAWYEAHWNEAEEVTEQILKVIERHTAAYLPFDVYARSLQQYFRGHEITVGEWERSHSKMFPLLDQYQREGYQALMKISGQFSGAFLCDGVGLGKTYVGLMVIERLVMHDRKRVLLLVPKSGRKPVWESALRKYLPHLFGDFASLVVLNHTDLQRSGEFPARLQRIREMADAVVIDEAHHFRNLGLKGEGEHAPSRYWKLFDLVEGKRLFLLTATPINNRLTDLQHLIELFSRRKPDYFKDAPLGIHSLPGHFRGMERELDRLTSGGGDQAQLEFNELEAERVLAHDSLFGALVVQRSRAYVRESQKQHCGNLAMFPHRTPPQLAQYSVKKTYGRLLQLVEEAFNKANPLFTLPMYFPLAYYNGTDIDPLAENRQKQVVGLIRVLFLKRFESSAKAFEASCEQLLLKLLAFMAKNSQTDGEKRRLERWRHQHSELIGRVREHQVELFGDGTADDAEDDIVTEELLDEFDELPRDTYKVDDMLAETLLDLDQVAKFLDELRKFKTSHDDKLRALIQLLKTDPVLKKHKVMIFSEFMATARYLRQQLIDAGIQGVDQIDSATKTDRGEAIRRFAPYYNDSSSTQLKSDGLTETRVLIATDVLSEGLNLQDATRLINYDLHWNPVRLMQRIGRVDRRLNPIIEQTIVADHPGESAIRGTVMYWNFLPPDELDNLLRLYKKVSHKTLRISKVFGIEGKQLLRPDDDYDALKDFNHSYEGEPSPLESMHLEYQRLLAENPELADRLTTLPLRLFSGKQHPTAGARAVFLCFALPARDPTITNPSTEAEAWNVEAGSTSWLLYDLTSESFETEASQIVEVIRCTPETLRRTAVSQPTLAEVRAKAEKLLKNEYLKQVQAPVGVKPELVAWMELN